MKWEVHTKHFCYEVWWLSLGRPSMQLFELQDKQHTFPPMEHHFYLKEWLTDTLCLFRLGYLADIFLELNEVTYRMENNWLYVLPVIKFEVSSEIQNSGKLVSTTLNLTILKDFIDDNSDGINKCSFWYCKNVWPKCKSYNHKTFIRKYMTLKAWAIKEKIDKFGFIRISNLCASKTLSRK